MITTFLLLIMCMMVGLAYVVVKSLITNQISEREYDNAMLRTLGWNKSHIVCQTVIKMLFMFVIPGFIVGISLSILTTYGVGEILNMITNNKIIFEFGNTSVWIGLLVAIVLPVLAFIRPVMQSLTIQLRDSLDIFRVKVETFEVVFTKI
jgi:predicted lysophospholipase L1 biosynthesis ABC-type transport system permease subunit